MTESEKSFSKTYERIALNMKSWIKEEYRMLIKYENDPELYKLTKQNIAASERIISDYERGKAEENKTDTGIRRIDY